MRKDKKVSMVEENLWNWFVGWCKQQGMTVTEYLEKHIQSLKK